MTFNSEQASAAAKRMHTLHDSNAITAKARAGIIAKFERLVDPDGTMDPAERLRLAEEERRNWYREVLSRARTARRLRNEPEAI